MMGMTIRGHWIGAPGMPVSVVPQIKELVSNSHFF